VLAALGVRSVAHALRMRLVARTALDGAGRNGDVTVVGPIAVPAGVAARGVSEARVQTAAVAGDLLAGKEEHHFLAAPTACCASSSMPPVPSALRVHCPELHLCTDNGTMIAMAAAMRLQAGIQQAIELYAFDVKPRWPRGDISGPVAPGP